MKTLLFKLIKIFLKPHTRKMARNSWENVLAKVQRARLIIHFSNFLYKLIMMNKVVVKFST